MFTTFRELTDRIFLFYILSYFHLKLNDYIERKEYSFKIYISKIVYFGNNFLFI